MDMSQIAPALANRQYCTRVVWGGRRVIAFGMDNALWGWYRHDLGAPVRLSLHAPCLADFTAEDWVRVPAFWNECREPWDSKAVMEFMCNLQVSGG